MLVVYVVNIENVFAVARVRNPDKFDFLQQNLINLLIAQYIIMILLIALARIVNG